MDTQTKRIKIATRCQFDEAGMTIPPAQRSRACQALQATGYTGNTSAEESPHTPEIGTSAIPNPAPDTESRKVQEVTATTNDDDLMPYDIYLSQDPFDQRLQIEIAVKGDHPNHPTLGLMMT